MEMITQIQVQILAGELTIQKQNKKDKNRLNEHLILERLRNEQIMMIEDPGGKTVRTTE
jgi:hypothetical protein